LAFNIIQSTCVFVLTFVFIYWYNNINSWEKAASQVIQCQVGTYGIPILNGASDSDGSLLELAYNCVNTVGKGGPPIWSHWLMHVCFSASAIGGLMLTCSTRNIKKYRIAVDWAQRQVTGSTNERPFISAMEDESRTIETEQQFEDFGSTSPVLVRSESTPDNRPRPSSKRNSNNWFCEVDSNDKGDATREILRFSITDEMSDRPRVISKGQADSSSNSIEYEREVSVTPPHGRRVELGHKLVDDKSIDNQGYGSFHDSIVVF